MPHKYKTQRITANNSLTVCVKIKSKLNLKVKTNSHVLTASNSV